MKIKDDLEVHSGFIEELFKLTDHQKERLDVISEKVSLHSYMLNETTKNNVDISKNLKDVRDNIDAINHDYLKKRSIMDFFHDLFNNPRMLVFGSILLIALSTFVACFEEVFRHLIPRIF